MKKIFANRTVWFYLELLSTLLILITVIVGWQTKGLLRNSFSTSIIIFAILGVIVECIYIYTDIEILPLFVTVFYALTVGMIGNQGSYVISDRVNGVSFLGGNFNMVILYLALSGIALLISIVVLFQNQRRDIEGQ